MCVVSMVMEHYWDRWSRPWPPDQPLPSPIIMPVYPVLPSAEEIAEFRRLLDRARKYDAEHNQPHCELQEKKDKLLNLARQLGIDISFVEAT